MSVLQASGLDTHFQPPERRWLSLYGQMVKPKRKQEIHIDEADLALIQKVFPEEILNTIFACLGPYTLGKAACVCKQWRHLAEHPRHWQAACQEAFGACHKDARPCQQLVRQSYRSSWRRLFLEVPHLRFDGCYVSRNTYVRQGVAEWRRDRTVHLVTYFRYFRFFPDGGLLYRTSPLTLRQVVKSLLQPPGPAQAGSGRHKYEQHVYSGRYVIKGSKVFLVIVYPNSRSTEVRARCAIRGLPVLGASNRLDLEELFSWDRDSTTSAPLSHAAPDEEPVGVGALTSYRRGLCSCVFVTWAGVADSPLNLSAKEMDIWLPG